MTYNFILILLFLIFFMNVPHSIKFVFFFVIILLLYGTRYHVGSDWYNYEFAYNHSLTHGDLGFSWLSSFLKYFGFDYLVMQFVTSFLSLFFIFKSLSFLLQGNKRLVGALLFFSVFLAYYFTFLRQALAVSIFYWSLKDIHEEKPFHYILKVVVAGLFHASLFVVLPLYVFLNKNLTRAVYFTVFFIVNFIFFTKIDVIGFFIQASSNVFPSEISMKLLGYIQNPEAIGIGIGYLIKTSIILFSLTYFNILKKNPYFLIVFNLFFLGYIIKYLAFNYYVISFRFGMIFLISEVFIGSYIFSSIKGYFKYVALFAYCMFMVNAKFHTVLDEDTIIFKYQNIFFWDKKIDQLKIKNTNKGYDE